MKKRMLEIYIYPLVFLFTLIFIISYLYILLFKGSFIFLMFEQVFVILLGLTIFVGRFSKFLFSWGPFVILFVAFQALRGIADDLFLYVNYQLPIQFEEAIFGKVLTISMQDFVNTLFSQSEINTLIILATFIYSLHFVFPLLFSYLLWNKNHKLFVEFMVAFTLLSYAALLTFMFFPVAPPWLAASEGHIPSIEHILIENDLISFFGIAISFIYFYINPNYVAAIPSLHAAYPFLIALFTIKLFGRKSFPIFLFPIIMGIDLIYLGEHYLIDILLGFFYAWVFYLITPKILNLIESIKSGAHAR